MTFFKHGLSFLSSLFAYKNRTFAAVWCEGERADVLRSIVSHESARNRQISRRIKRPPSQCTGIEMAVGISIMVLEFYIPGVRSPGGKIPPRLHPSGSAQVRCSEAKPGSGRDPGHSPLRFQSDCDIKVKRDVTQYFRFDIM